MQGPELLIIPCRICQPCFISYEAPLQGTFEPKCGNKQQCMIGAQKWKPCYLVHIPLSAWTPNVAYIGSEDDLVFGYLILSCLAWSVCHLVISCTCSTRPGHTCHQHIQSSMFVNASTSNDPDGSLVPGVAANLNGTSSQWSREHGTWSKPGAGGTQPGKIGYKLEEACTTKLAEVRHDAICSVDMHASYIFEMCIIMSQDFIHISKV